MTREEKERRFLLHWEGIGICNDFIFCKVMMDEELLTGLVRLVLPDVSFSRLIVQSQKTVEAGLDVHGVRFDIFALDEDGTAIVIEMQVLNRGNLPRRVRFYGSALDAQMLEKGVSYSELRDSYVIILTPFDPYGLGLHRYTFTNRCHEERGLEMGDGTKKIFLNSAGVADDVGDGLKAFLDYMAGMPPEDEYIRKLEAAVWKTRQNKDWRREYMTLYMRDLENQEIGREEGRVEGRKEGREEGREKTLISQVCKKSRKGNTSEEIADILEEDTEHIRTIYDIAKKYAPDYDEEAIYRELSLAMVHENSNYGC